MSGSSLQPMHAIHFYICGNVTLHPNAVVAADVMLQADPGSHLVIGARASIGPGSVLHAHQGTLTVEEDAILGAQVLVVGEGCIGSGACIGAFSTLMFHIHVHEQQVIPPRSLLGDESRQIPDLVDTEDSPNGQGTGESVAARNGSRDVSEQAAPTPTDSPSSAQGVSSQRSPFGPAGSEQSTVSTSDSPASAQAPVPSSVGPSSVGYVYGRASVERLIQVMFPMNPRNNSVSDELSSGKDASHDPSSSSPEER